MNTEIRIADLEAENAEHKKVRREVAEELKERADELLRNRWDYVTDFALHQWAAKLLEGLEAET